MSAPQAAPAVLIAALSGRALAVAARRAGYAPLVADLFGDADTRAAAAGSVVLPGGLSRGLRGATLLPALARLAAGRVPAGVVCGSGFEDRPRLLEAVARQYSVLGNNPATLRRVKDPLALAATCGRLGIAHPEIRFDAAPDRGWLTKRAGAAGGWHVRPAQPGRMPGIGHYLQRRMDGTPVSALFLADGRRALVLGFSTQWSASAPARPFRYGGAARPAAVGVTEQSAMEQAVAGFTREAGLRGLNSADFLLADGASYLLDVNPRPGASLDVFPDPRGALFRLHLAACDGKLPDAAPRFAGANAAAVVYAPGALRLRSDMSWPDWTADRPAAGITIPAGAPVCTVLAGAADAHSARRLVESRAAIILAHAEEYA